MELAEFQKRTVQVACEALEADGPRRFLVADEVGLGKTVIARAIAEELRSNRRRLTVMYMCPSLEIAGQNRPKFVSLTKIDEKSYDPGGDRLALVPGALPSEGEGFRIFSFTPETSLPGWKPGPRSGRKAERALILSVLDRYQALLAAVLRLHRDRLKSRGLFESRGDLTGYTAIGIERAMRDVFDCQVGNVERTIVAWLGRDDVDLLEFVARFRSVLALAALRSRSVRPDLLILDEFHRYADLLIPEEKHSVSRVALERARVHRLLVEALLGGPDRPAVLLLSATPYRLRRLDGEEIHPVDRYRSLVDLVGFLADDKAHRDHVESAFAAYHEALGKTGTPDGIRQLVHASKVRLEKLLRPLMARTERALVHEEDLFERTNRQVEIQARDLVLFRHFAETSGSDFAGWAPAMWSSIPYPTQTMHGYKVWEVLAKAKPAPIEAGAGRGEFAHPQLRQLAEFAGQPAHLSLPWQPPTVGWWKLEGPWSAKKHLPGKTLLFSRWRGAPTAISALLSIQLSGGLRNTKEKAPIPLLRSGGGETGALVGLFMQWPTLSTAIDPAKSMSSSIAAVRRDAAGQLGKFLRGNDIALDGREKRPTWIVAAGIERALGSRTYESVCALAAQSGQGARARDWRTLDRIVRISQAELAALAEHLLSAPGSILARCVARHDVPQDRQSRRRVFDFAWYRLRPYLGHRTFAELILAATKLPRYPDALAEAMLKGGFEAVLDEQMGLLGRMGDAKGIKIVDQLSASVLERPGSVQFRRGKAKYRVPVQAVTPFAGGNQDVNGRKKGKRLRSDALRRAFNSPFWPHMLCTTSVGQEGLDFHLWCSRIVHWDLPGDPVDFEQREGRIARYGSLAVRRSLACDHGPESLLKAEFGSPFGKMIDLARQVQAGRTGLERWWLPQNGRPTSVSFDWRFSQRASRRETMLKDLLYYRLALGQPDPEAFVAMLRRVGADGSDARGLAVDLSAISRFV